MNISVQSIVFGVTGVNHDILDTIGLNPNITEDGVERGWHVEITNISVQSRVFVHTVVNHDIPDTIGLNPNFTEDRVGTG